ncbi:MAG: NEL-type E3 ubiquitin ligase domain-containing protein, partial [Chlamydiota bacterium]
MSFPGNISNITPISTALPLTTTTAQPIVTAQNALQQHTAVTDAPIPTVSRVQDCEEINTIQNIAQSILTPTAVKPPLQEVLNQWAGNNLDKMNAAAAISHCITDQRTTLDLQNLSLTSLPEIFDYPELHHLQMLYLNDNMLTLVPTSIGELKSLRSLDLNNNKLIELPDSIGHLTNLIALNLEGNELTELPDFLNHLKKLEALYLNENQLTKLPDSIGQLTALEALDLDRNQLTELPDSIRHLTALKSLDLSDNEFISLSDVIGQLVVLKSLNLSSNNLTTLPDSIGQLTTLETLDLSYNNLSYLPNSIGQLTALKELFLFENLFTTLPDSICQLTALKELNVGANQLTQLPNLIGQLTALELLDFHENALVFLPDSIGHLTVLATLDLTHNQLQELPNSMRQLTALETLLLERNNLRELPNFLRNLNLQIHDLPFFVNIESITEEIYSLAGASISEALQKLYTNTTNSNRGRLKAWLGRLKDTSPGKVKDVNFYRSIVHILDLASTNEAFYETFWNVIADAATTCGDRVALSILDLDITRQLMILDLQKHLHVADFLKRGVWTYNLLKQHAGHKVLELRGAINKREDLSEYDKNYLIEAIEEIEIYLGYPIKLREA